MRKLIVIMSLLIVVIATVFPLDISAITYESSEWYTDTSVGYNLPLLNNDGSFQKNVKISKIVHKSDGEPAFCVEPHKENYFANEYSSIKTDEIFSSLSQRIEVAKVVMAYKSLETNYASISTATATYAAAQYIIWDILGFKFDTTSSNSDYSAFSSEISKIQKAKQTFEQSTLSPNLSFDDVTYSIGDRVYITDNSGIISSANYKVTASEGIDDIKIEDGVVSFKISSVTPTTKTINLEYVGEVPARWEYGEIWSDGKNQNFFSFFSVDLPYLYGNASVSIEVEAGDLTIIKLDESGEVIEDGDFTFTLYEAIQDEQGYSIGDVLKGYEKINVRGSNTIKVAPGYYYIKETTADASYLLDERAYLIEVIADSETKFSLVNKYKTFTIEVSKYDQDNASPVGGAGFTVYSLQQSDDSIYLLKTGETIDLSTLLKSNNLYIAEEDIYFDGTRFLSDKNSHIVAYAISDNTNEFTLEGFEALVYRSSSYIDPLEGVRVYKGSSDLSETLECLYDGSSRVVYKFDDENNQYLIIRPKATYDISEPEIEAEAIIYMISADFDIFTGSSDIYNGSAYSVLELDSSVTSNMGKAYFSGLMVNKDYLLCEVSLPEDYEYGIQDPCIVTSEDTVTVTNVSFTNKMRSVTINVFKTDENREILLNGAEFIAYKLKKSDYADIALAEEVPEDASYMGYFISGYLHVTLADFGIVDDSNIYTLAIYSDGELIKEVAMGKEVNIDGLADGVYDLYLRDDNGSTLSTIFNKEVARGKIFFDDIRYDEVLILFEVKAPEGYRNDTSAFVVSTDGAVINGSVSYNRINEAIILPYVIVDTACYGH